MNGSRRELGWLMVVCVAIAMTGCGGKSDPGTDGGAQTLPAGPVTGKTPAEKVNDPTVFFYTYIEAGCKNCTDVAALFDELAVKYKGAASFERRDSTDKTYEQEKKRLGLAGHVVAVVDGDGRLIWATRSHQQSLATVRAGIETHLDK